MNIRGLKSSHRKKFSKVTKTSVPALNSKGIQEKDAEGNLKFDVIRERVWLDDTPCFKDFARQNGVVKLRMPAPDNKEHRQRTWVQAN